MLKFLLLSKDVLYQVSSDLIEVNSFYSSFSDTGQKAPLPFKSSEKPASYSVKSFDNSWGNPYKKSVILDNLSWNIVDCQNIMTTFVDTIKTAFLMKN